MGEHWRCPRYYPVVANGGTPSLTGKYRAMEHEVLLPDNVEVTKVVEGEFTVTLQASLWILATASWYRKSSSSDPPDSPVYRARDEISSIATAC